MWLRKIKQEFCFLLCWRIIGSISLLISQYASVWWNPVENYIYVVVVDQLISLFWIFRTNTPSAYIFVMLCIELRSCTYSKIVRYIFLVYIDRRRTIKRCNLTLSVASWIWSWRFFLLMLLLHGLQLSTSFDLYIEISNQHIF